MASAVFPGVAQSRADTCLLHHSWELMQRARESSKNLLPPGRPAGTSKLQISSAVNHAASGDEPGTASTFSQLGCFLYAYVRENADNPPERLLFVHRQAFGALITGISD